MRDCKNARSPGKLCFRLKSHTAPFLIRHFTSALTIGVLRSVGMTPRASKLRSADPNLSEIARLIADPSRSAILLSLIDGGELPASELAFRAATSPQSASAHLAKLAAGGLLTVTTSGRQRLFRLASADVAHAIEVLVAIARPTPIESLNQSATLQRLREARSCYDHLAGRLGVVLTDRFIEIGAIALCGRSFEVTHLGERFFRELGIDVDGARVKRRSFAFACIDWTERRPHVAGCLGASILEHFLTSGWVVRNARDRALHVTPEGHTELASRFHIDS